MKSSWFVGFKCVRARASALERCRLHSDCYIFSWMCRSCESLPYIMYSSTQKNEFGYRQNCIMIEIIHWHLVLIALLRLHDADKCMFAVVEKSFFVRMKCHLVGEVKKNEWVSKRERDRERGIQANHSGWICAMMLPGLFSTFTFVRFFLLHAPRVTDYFSFKTQIPARNSIRPNGGLPPSPEHCTLVSVKHQWIFFGRLLVARTHQQER